MKESRELSAAIIAAKKAGKIIMNYYDKDKGTTYKDGKHNALTKADIESQKAIIALLSREFPKYGIIAEEADVKNVKEKTWVIDPLDGTINFSRKVPHFGISIGLMKGSDFVLGVIFDPLKKEMFTAEKGRGAFLNSKRISVSDSDNFDRLLLVTERITRLGEDSINKISKTDMRFLGTTSLVRNSGSAVLDMGYVACGRLDAYFQIGAHLWDYAAGVCIVREAGGRVDNDKNGWTVIATNGKIHDKFVEMISK